MDVNEDIEYKRRSTSVVEDQWVLGGTISVSGLSDTSEARERPKQNLQIVQNREYKSDRPRLKATMWEILCFFRVYTTTICKSQILTLGEEDINRFFWYRVGNLICSSMQHVFVQVFLAAYVPDAHFYLNKMNPLTCGYNFTVIIAALFELVLFINSNVLLMDYFWHSLFKKSPWKRCHATTMMFVDHDEELEAECLTLEQFTEKVSSNDAENKTLYFHKQAYYYENGNETKEYFQLSHLVHFWHRVNEKRRTMELSIFFFYFILICVFSALQYEQVFKKCLWKALKFSHYAEFVVHCFICIYIYILDKTVYRVSRKSVIKIANMSKRCLVDVNYLAIMLNAPPVAQILISRSTKNHSKIEYESISMLLVFSNWIYGFLTAVTSNSIKHHCEALLGVTIHLSDLNSGYFFYLYPIFFSRFFIGNILFAIIVFAKLLADLYTFIITHQCLVEAIISEWNYVSKVFIHIGLTSAGTLIYMFIAFDHQMILYMYGKVVAILVEVLGIYCLYPAERLIEDLTFHRGTTPNSLRMWCLRFVSAYVLYKIYTIVDQINEVITTEEAKWLWLVPIIPLFLGFVYKILMHRCVEKKPWSLLVVPTNEWGPDDYTTRYCRKIYKSDEYIGSQADRKLSRYMLSKTESEVMHLDIRYDVPRRSTAVSQSYMRYEDEKKNA